jgi:hypothetical protein
MASARTRPRQLNGSHNQQSMSGSVMDREEARNLLVAELTRFRKMSHAELVARIDNDEYLEVTGPSNTVYQIEIQFMWDHQQGGDIRVLAGIDDGSLRGAFRPVCEDFLVQPDGRVGDT